jgi:hypothetical protein
MSVSGYKGLLHHVRHKVVCVTYQHPEDIGVLEPDNVALECKTCNEILIDFDKPHDSGDYRDIVRRSRLIEDKNNKLKAKRERKGGVK